MKQLLVTISASQPLAPHLDLLTLVAPELPPLRAGQLLLARWPGRYDPYVRAAHFAIPSAESCLIIVSTGEHKARPYEVGDVLDVLAPVGKGFRLEASTRRLLLAGDEWSLAPLLALANEATQKQVAVTLLIQQSSSVGRFYEALLPLDVEFQVAPQWDVSAELLDWCDQVCVAGPHSTYIRLKERIAESAVVHTAGFAQAVVVPAMPCGFGACLGCAVETTRGLKLACVEGPVFDLMELVV
jgi:dihydroorotate dehydrogenase electron transfer subunit